jgi:hypothetical protein
MFRSLISNFAPYFEYCICSFGYFAGIRLCFADVSEPSVRSSHRSHFIFNIQPLKMDLTEDSESSANHNLTPGKYAKEHVTMFRSLYEVQCVRKVAVHSGYGPYIWLSVPKLPLQCAAVSLYSAVKQRLKRNTGKVCDCLVQFLLTVVLSIEECVFISAQRLCERNEFLFVKGPWCSS